MNNKILKTCSVALMAMSAGAITGCSGIKSYKNEVTEAEFLASFKEAREKYTKTATELLDKQDKNLSSMKEKMKAKVILPKK